MQASVPYVNEYHPDLDKSMESDQGKVNWIAHNIWCQTICYSTHYHEYNKSYDQNRKKSGKIDTFI